MRVEVTGMTRSSTGIGKGGVLSIDTSLSMKAWASDHLGQSPFSRAARNRLHGTLGQIVGLLHDDTQTTASSPFTAKECASGMHGYGWLTIE
jgi:hypothetical protein